jgi:hypothetical protein
MDGSGGDGSRVEEASVPVVPNLSIAPGSALCPVPNIGRFR